MGVCVACPMKTAKALLIRVLGAVGLERIARSIWVRIRYSGTRYECPICSAHLRRFLPGGEHFPVLAEKSVIGGGYRANMFCPVCGSTPSQWSADMPPREPTGTPPRAESMRAGWYVNGSWPSSAVSSGAASATRTSSATTAAATRAARCARSRRQN